MHLDRPLRRISLSVPNGATVLFNGIRTRLRRSMPGTDNHTFPLAGWAQVVYWSERTMIWFAIRLRPRCQCWRINRDR